MMPNLGLCIRLWILIVTIPICFATQDVFASSHKSKKTHRQQKPLLSQKKPKPSISAVFDRICQSKIRFPKIVMQQVILETGWLKSEHLMSKNNLFGFRTKQYLSFKDWESSVEHYKAWQFKRLREDDRDYYKVLEAFDMVEATFKRIQSLKRSIGLRTAIRALFRLTNTARIALPIPSWQRPSIPAMRKKKLSQRINKLL